MNNLSKEVIAKIKRNLSHNNAKDVKQFRIKGTLTYDDYMRKIEEQDNKCYICLQEFKYDGGNWCYFFPSADRLYNYSPHSNNNCQIACLFCNIRMFKQIDIKKCGLCEGLNHAYDGDIITKSRLFRALENNNYSIRQYILCKTPISILENKLSYMPSIEDIYTPSSQPTNNTL